ncbi:MAG: hypothetical protein IGR93_16795 [Hydrococcus sp. C42_A2020_068]|uniref:hypothetical protein n=1 Tax=Pleurocapsa sp. PCC 7327 TaxID=118163 RepID=UPI00029F9A6E|nr:hypothetical protein [Pleurocapsa sp. PCC 7327]AFY78520.1 hypothetical protein Ple7327_3300 [Pleurocapsa sp. PCC 7327]MBF2021702.1 hypothetical protein [Hydrococcus sp. C42_A2020_068]
MSNQRTSITKAPSRAPKRQQALEIDKIREIIETKVLAAEAKIASQATEDPKVILKAVRNAMSEVIALLPDQQTEINETITAAIEGLIHGIIIPKRSAINRIQKQIQELQAKEKEEEQKLQAQIDGILKVVEDLGNAESDNIHDAIALALKAIEDKKEMEFFLCASC